MMSVVASTTTRPSRLLRSVAVERKNYPFAVISIWR